MASLPTHTGAAGLPAVWLRHNCRCAACLDPVMAGTPVTFSYRDQRTQLSATRPLIGLDPRGRIREIRCNGRSLQPSCLSPAEAAGFYRAYRAFAALASDPAALRTVRLAPGDCVVFDNTRVLHGRTGFTGQGGRHLQGCYADLDGVESAVAVAGRARERKGRTGHDIC